MHKYEEAFGTHTQILIKFALLHSTCRIPQGSSKTTWQAVLGVLLWV